MPSPPSSTKQAKQSSHLAPRDELGAWQARQAQEGLTQNCSHHFKLFVAATKTALLAVLAISITALSSCLDFGEETEWIAPDVTKLHLEQIGNMTLIPLPAGTEGLAYLFDGRGIDGAMAAKLRIPPEKEAELLSAEIFTKGEKKQPAQGIGPGRPWWKAGSMSTPIARTMTIKGNQYLGCIYGKEGSDHILYITWFDT
jgi:hypothetical protein